MSTSDNIENILKNSFCSPANIAFVPSKLTPVCFAPRRGCTHSYWCTSVIEEKQGFF